MGEDPQALSTEARTAWRLRTVGFVFQQFHLLAGRTALENVEMPLLIGGVAAGERRARATALLDRVGLAGLFQLSRLRQGDPTVAVGLELDIIAAVIIGGASLSGGVGTILGSMIGALIMAVLRNGSQQMGWPTYFQEIIIGLVIIVAVFLDRLRQGKQT